MPYQLALSATYQNRQLTRKHPCGMWVVHPVFRLTIGYQNQTMDCEVYGSHLDAVQQTIEPTHEMLRQWLYGVTEDAKLGTGSYYEFCYLTGMPPDKHTEVGYAACQDTFRSFQAVGLNPWDLDLEDSTQISLEFPKHPPTKNCNEKNT